MEITRLHLVRQRLLQQLRQVGRRELLEARRALERRREPPRLLLGAFQQARLVPARPSTWGGDLDVHAGGVPLARPHASASRAGRPPSATSGAAARVERAQQPHAREELERGRAGRAAKERAAQPALAQRGEQQRPRRLGRRRGQGLLREEERAEPLGPTRAHRAVRGDEVGLVVPPAVTRTVERATRGRAPGAGAGDARPEGFEREGGLRDGAAQRAVPTRGGRAA